MSYKLMNQMHDCILSARKGILLRRTQAPDRYGINKLITSKQKRHYENINFKIDYYTVCEAAKEYLNANIISPTTGDISSHVFETSSKTGHNVVDLFERISKDFVVSLRDQPAKRTAGAISLGRRSTQADMMDDSGKGKKCSC
jgi:hypothetical protein